MGQPTPPGDIPLVEGLGPEWNDIVSAIPEAQRAEIGPKLKERISGYEPLKQWEDFHKSGITPEHASNALNLYSIIENNPREVYNTLAQHLGISTQQAKEVVEEIEDAAEDGDNERLSKLQNQIDTMAQIMMAQRNQSVQQQQAEAQDRAIENEINEVKKKYGNDIPEDQLLMRMLHKNMSAEEAYQEYSGFVSEIQKRRPAPMLLGSGGSIPTSRAIDPTKLDSKGTKNLVAQMLDHANAERRS